MSFLLWLYLSDSHKENLQKKNAKQNPTQLKNIAHAHSTSTSRVHSRVEQSHLSGRAHVQNALYRHYPGFTRTNCN